MDLRKAHEFDRAYRTLAGPAFSAAHAVLRDAQAAEDVVQDVFVHLWLNPNSFDPARGSLRGYVTMLARSRALDRWRSRSVREDAVDRSVREASAEVMSEESAAEPVIRRERSETLLCALDTLPNRQRQAVLLAFGRGLTAREIARVTEVPVGTAKSRVRLGLRRAEESLDRVA
jgi:RNA polymerase sigma-70 factor, ECF subfamily